MTSWNNLDPAIRTTAEHALTARQLDVLKLHLAGCGTRRIATMLNIAEPTAREHLRRAKANLAQHLNQPSDATGADLTRRGRQRKGKHQNPPGTQENAAHGRTDATTKEAA